MNPEEPVRDMMRRTMCNLRVIEEQATRYGPYEITQLVNSFLGALAHPWERFKTDLEAMTIDDAEAQGWPVIAKERDTDYDPQNVGDLLRLMRNGIAHGNIAFLPNDRAEIRAIRLWNTNPQTRQRTWGAVITVDTMRELLEQFVELAEQLCRRRNTPGEQGA
jgi:hypothetical protein